MIDVGEYWDVAVQSLCTKKQKLLISGGTFAQQLTVDVFRPGDGCFACSIDLKGDNETVAKLMPSKIESLTNIEFIPRDVNPIA